MSITCFKLQLLRTGHAAREGIYKVLWVSVVQSPEVVTILGSSAFLLMAGRHITAGYDIHVLHLATKATPLY